MSEHCPFCHNPVNPYDAGTWKQVTGWVGGPRKDSMRLREDIGVYAHDHCIAKVQAGQAPDQPELFDDDDYNPGGRRKKQEPLRRVENVDLPPELL